jgi:hypothetical protein
MVSLEIPYEFVEYGTCQRFPYTRDDLSAKGFMVQLKISFSG